MVAGGVAWNRIDTWQSNCPHLDRYRRQAGNARLVVSYVNGVPPLALSRTAPAPEASLSTELENTATYWPSKGEVLCAYLLVLKNQFLKVCF